MSVHADATALAGEMTALRHAIHREPEIGLELPRTQAKLLAALERLPLEITKGDRLNSVTAVLRGGQPGPVVLLRADMDALPVTECTGVAYASRTDGAMHACGHDTHTAMLAGAAELLTARRAELPGSVIFMFQPGEECADGAAHMIDEGVPGRHVEGENAARLGGRGEAEPGEPDRGCQAGSYSRNSATTTTIPTRLHRTAVPKCERNLLRALGTLPRTSW